MRVLIIGGGGREHALAWKAAQSARVRDILVAPGNAGTAHEVKCRNTPVAADDVGALVALAQRERVDLAIVGPEAPLVRGVVDRFAAAGVRCFGPTAAAAQLEGSKAFAKDFLARHDIPSARYGTFADASAAKAFVERMNRPMVVKADGLAAGKGVFVPETKEQTLSAIDTVFRDFGRPGSRVVVEDKLQGEEASFIVMVDGRNALPLATSQDHKRAYDGDRGPNTGGMGAYSPAPVVTPVLHRRIMHDVIEPAVRGMVADGCPYTGFLYAGLMIAPDGTPNVLEFNCRFGDPEAQPVLMRLRSDFVDLVEAALAGTLDQVEADWDSRAALGVVMAAGGYPGAYRKGDVIAGLPGGDAPDMKVFHAGTTERDGSVVTNGGRVLCVTALGATVAAAQKRAYEAVREIHWHEVHFRSDIGDRAVARERQSAR